MSPAVEFVALSDGQIRSRFDRLLRHLDHWGDVVATDAGRLEDRRMLEFAVVSPGGDLDVETRELFREYYQRNRAGVWDIVKYTYEYLDVVRGVRLAFHVHDLGGRRRVAHAHCEESFDIPEDERSAHFRAVEYDLREAHDVFMRHYAAGIAPDCSTFLPLAVNRE